MRIRRAIASLLGPVVIALVMITRRLPGEPVTWLLAVSEYVMAHFIFWPALIATRLVARRVKLASTSKLVLLMACFSAAVSLLCAIPLVYIHVPGSSYGWHEAILDTIDIAVAGAGALILYQVLMDRVMAIVRAGRECARWVAQL